MSCEELQAMAQTAPLVPSQQEVDTLASFLLAVDELKDEPFFSKDEPRTISSMGTKYQSFRLGDRFHFRSALITFRRIWMKGDAENFDRVCNILWKHLPAEPRALLKAFRANVNREKSSEIAWPKIAGVTGERLVDLWLYAVFAHSGLRKNGESRKAFDQLVEQAGHGIIEYAFRHIVWCIGLHYMNVAKLARPLLQMWRETYSVAPSFAVRAAFGIKRRERTLEGHLIIRQSSSEYFTEESFEQRFTRVLQRQEFGNLKSVLDQLKFPGSELSRQVLKHPSIVIIIAASELELKIVTSMPEQPTCDADLRFFCGLWDRRTGQVSRLQCSEIEIVTDEVGIQIIDASLVMFRVEFLK